MKIWFDFDIDIQAGLLISIYPHWNTGISNIVISFMCFNLYVYWYNKKHDSIEGVI